MKKYGMEQITRQIEQPTASTVVSTSDIVKDRLDKDTNASCEFKQGYVTIAVQLHTHVLLYSFYLLGFLFQCLTTLWKTTFLELPL